jgi:sulfur-oxidizing protein SoxX
MAAAAGHPRCRPASPLGRRGPLALAAVLVASAPAGVAAAQAAVAPYAGVGDAIRAPLTGEPGDPARGRALVVDRSRGLCLLCHSGPFPEERLQGNLGPDLGGVGARLSEGQLRLRLVDGRRTHPATIMPSYHRIDHLANVGAAWRGRPVLTAREVEDVVAFLRTLRD